MDTKVNAVIAELVQAGAVIKDFHLVGSTFILGKGADVDVLLLVSSTLNALHKVQNAGYAPDCTTHYAGADFHSLRKGDVNLILTESGSYFRGFVKAAKVCKLLKVADKPMRIAIHDLIRDDIEPIEDIFA